ncbi:MAG: hypothetical protein ACKVJK_21305 [Methylophagaceae bacterium]|jgi:hypothetical protein|tara:strand:- start:2656 stop:2811 length:156 start_codon:yes stop_codon:yes gene_type:complete
MNKLIGLVGGFFIMGSVGGLENDTMTILETLIFAALGFSMIFHVLVKKELI